MGRRGELAAARLLERGGYTILAGGHRSRYGEIDLIAVDHHGASWSDRLLRPAERRRTIVFTEVKTRRGDHMGHPASAVDSTKQRKLSGVALAYLKAHHLLHHPARFDIVAITWPKNARQPTKVEHFRNAFEAVGFWQMYS